MSMMKCICEKPRLHFPLIYFLLITAKAALGLYCSTLFLFFLPMLSTFFPFKPSNVAKDLSKIYVCLPSHLFPICVPCDWCAACVTKQLCVYCNQLRRCLFIQVNLNYLVFVSQGKWMFLHLQHGDKIIDISRGDEMKLVNTVWRDSTGTAFRRCATTGVNIIGHKWM